MPSDADKFTPMMQQYFAVKGGLPRDTLLLFRLGDFYEMFFEDAVVGSRLLGLTLTKRQEAPMAGIPYHAVDTYVSKILAAGKKVAICDQQEAARPGKLVRRELTRILFHQGIAEFRVNLSQSANQAVPDKLRSRKLAVPKPGRLEIVQGIPHCGHNAISKPDSRLGLESPRKRLRYRALAPAAQAAMSVRRTQINLLPG